MILPRENPFRSACISNASYHFPDDLSCDSLLARLRALGNRGALVGPEGSGKTTLLEHLASKLKELGRRPVLLGLSCRSDPIPALPANRDFLLLDSAERFGFWEWRRFKWQTRTIGGLIITSHRPGLLPTLFECRTSPELFANIVHDLLRRSLLAQPSPPDLSELFAAHGGNIRNALRELYDRFACLSPVTERHSCFQH